MHSILQVFKTKIGYRLYRDSSVTTHKSFCTLSQHPNALASPPQTPPQPMKTHPLIIYIPIITASSSHYSTQLSSRLSHGPKLIHYLVFNKGLLSQQDLSYLLQHLTFDIFSLKTQINQNNSAETEDTRHNITAQVNMAKKNKTSNSLRVGASHLQRVVSHRNLAALNTVCDHAGLVLLLWASLCPSRHPFPSCFSAFHI